MKVARGLSAYGGNEKKLPVRRNKLGRGTKLEPLGWFIATLLRSRFPRNSKVRQEERTCGLNFPDGECVNEWQGPVRPKLAEVCARAVNCPRDFRGLLAHRRSRIGAGITELAYRGGALWML